MLIWAQSHQSSVAHKLSALFPDVNILQQMVKADWEPSAGDQWLPVYGKPCKLPHKLFKLLSSFQNYQNPFENTNWPLKDLIKASGPFRPSGK